MKSYSKTLGLEKCKDEDVRPISTSEKREGQEPELQQGEQSLLAYIVAHPLSGVVERYRRLGINAHQGGKLRASLARRGLIQERDVATRTGRVKLLSLTERGRQVADSLAYKLHVSTRTGGYDHEYWRKRAARHFAEQGWQVSEEHPIGGGKTVDLVIVKGGQRIAVEVETGKSDAIRNMRKDLEAGFDHVISVALTAGVKKEIERQLESAQLSHDQSAKILTLTELVGR